MMTYEYDAEANIVHLRASGVLVRDDPISYFHALSQDQELKPQAIERVYFENLEDIAFSYSDICQIRDTFDFLGHGDRFAYTVFITDSDLSYGMARMIISIIEHPTHDFRIERIEQSTN